MKINDIKNPSPEEILDLFREFLILCKEMLGLKKLPEIKWLIGRDFHQQHHSFGSFANSSEVITVEIANRHILDVMRTLAHELVHYKQYLNGEINPRSGDDGSPQENEAHAVAGLIMRKFDNAHPEAFDIKPLSEGLILTKRLMEVAQKRKVKGEVKYQDHPKKDDYCELCTMFKKPDQCTAVIGKIDPKGWCKLFEADKKKKKKLQDKLNQAVSELQEKLLATNKRSHTYDEIDKMMKDISEEKDITPKQLHDAFKKKQGVTPDEWIEYQEVG
jgi:hypothetical protein